MSDIAARITGYFEEDQLSGRIATKAGDIPISYEAIASEWFTATLCADYPGAQVIAYTLDEPDDGTANRRRIFLTYNEAGNQAGLPRTIFCKAAHSLSNRLMLGIYGALHSEVTFYNKIAASLDVPVPHCFYADYDPERCTYIALFKDMAGNASFCDHHTRIDRARVEDQVGLLARIHGQFTGRPLTGPAIDMRPYPEYWDNLVTCGLKEFSNKGFLAAEGVIPRRLFKRYDEAWPAAVAALDQHRTLPPTLMHGDCHLKNWYIDADGRMGLGDWQAVVAGYGLRDFAYTITTSLTVEDRRAWEKDLLTLYQEGFAANGGAALDFDAAWTLYRQQLASVLPYWTVTLTPAPDQPDMQPTDITIELIRRIACAMDDLDTLDSFG